MHATSVELLLCGAQLGLAQHLLVLCSALARYLLAKGPTIAQRHTGKNRAGPMARAAVRPSEGVPGVVPPALGTSFGRPTWRGVQWPRLATSCVPSAMGAALGKVAACNKSALGESTPLALCRRGIGHPSGARKPVTDLRTAIDRRSGFECRVCRAEMLRRHRSGQVDPRQPPGRPLQDRSRPGPGEVPARNRRATPAF